MSKYKETIIEILDDISKEYFSKQRTAEEESFASMLFSKFKYQIKNSTDIKILFMLLQIMAAEGVMLNGTRELEKPRINA
jgi:hypothetical protein